MRCEDCSYRNNCISYKEDDMILGCESGKPPMMTNADRIRSMTNAELAESRIDNVGIYSSSRNRREDMWAGDFYGVVNSKEESLRLELEWLESEASE